MQRVGGAAAVVDQHDEVRPVVAGFGAVAVGHFEAEIVVLDVGDDARVLLGDAAELGFPVAVQHQLTWQRRASVW